MDVRGRREVPGTHKKRKEHDLMGWFKTDDQLAFHAKVVAAGNSAMGLWIRAGSWSSAQLTDGFIPTHMANAMANAMANPCDQDALVDAGLWDEVDGGFRFHDWSEFQPSAEEERAKRKARSLAGKKGAAARWDGKPHSKSHGKSDATAMANECDSDAPTRPDPTEEAKASSSRTKRGTRIPADFEVGPEMIAWAGINAPTVDGPRETAKFINYWQAKAGREGVKLDWMATWRNWMLNAAERAPQSKPSTGDKMRDTLTRGQALQDRLNNSAGQTILEIGA
jgi:hypothetical protein